MPVILDKDRAELACDSIRRRHKAFKDSQIGILAFKSVDMEVDMEAGNRDIFGVATTDDVDESEEVVLPEGADLSYIEATKKLYADHQYGVESDIGIIRYVKMLANGRGWKYRARFYENLRNPLADDTLEKIKQSGTYGVSIGFDPIEGGSPTPIEQKKYPAAKSIIRRWKWIELSVTPMPCNSYSYAVPAGELSDSKRFELIERLVGKELLTKDQACRLGVAQAVERRILKLGGEFPSARKVLRLA